MLWFQEAGGISHVFHVKVDSEFTLGNLGMIRALCIWQLLFGVYVA